MRKELPKRKEIRIQNYNYSKEGYYFITICTADKKKILSEINCNKNNNQVNIKLLDKGKISKKYIESINEHYKNINITDYVIMTNHIHMVLEIERVVEDADPYKCKNSIHCFYI